MPFAAFHRLRAPLLTWCLFAFVVGANWATFDRFGSDMPDWDQWDAEALNLIAPWFEHDHFVAHLFEPHNEHRVVMTKLQNLAVILASGQWDARLECLFNATLHGLIAIALWLIGRRWIATRWHALYFVVLASLYGLPLAWQNLLGGFHSQQYWLIGLSFAAIVTVPFARTGSGSWWLGTAAAALALLSMGSGFLAALVIAGVIGWRWLLGQTKTSGALVTLAICAVLVAIGFATRVEVYYHESLKAKTAHDFIFSLLRSLEWPLQDADWAGVLLWLPFLLVTWRFATRSSVRQSRAAQTLLALGGWVLIQLLATAYARGAGADYPASRYMDTLIFATAVNALALGWLASAPREPDGHGQRSRPVAIVALTALAWFVPLGIGTHALVIRNVGSELPSTKDYYVHAESHLRAYLATNDATELTDPIPYPGAGSLIERLAHPSLRALAPQSVRPSLAVVPAEPPTSFLANHVAQKALDTAPRTGLAPETPALGTLPTWGSYNGDGRGAVGVWQSAPLQAPLHGWLRFETAGDLGESGESLELHDADTQALITAVRPDKHPGNSWRSAYVRAPRGRFVIIARDRDATRWMAFSAPVEMSNGSYYGWRVMKQGLVIAITAAVVALLIALSHLLGQSGPRGRTDRRQRHAAPPAPALP